MKNKLKNTVPKKIFPLSAISLSLLSLGAIAEPAASISQAIADGKATLSFRYRYEMVDQDNSLEDANASTLKSRLNFTTKVYNNFQAFVEVDDVSALGSDSYNDTHNGRTSYSVVADPEGTDVNQVWLRYSGFEKTHVSFGRQRINFDNQRFIGGVGWRQNEQTYDAFAIENSSLADTTARYIYVDNVNRIFGPGDGVQLADFGTNAHLINVSYEGWSLGKLSLYGYLMDVQDAHAFATETYGLRFSGGRKLKGGNKLMYSAEFSTQEDYGDHSGQTSFDADYYAFEGGISTSHLSAKIGYEVLGGSSGESGQAFRTPFATLHKFNGWADQFLSTPGAGLEDAYVNLSGAIAKFKLMLVYHDFSAEDSGGDYGSEIDFSISRSINPNVSVLLKYADYSADGEARSELNKVDTQKLWLMFSLKF